MSASRIEVVALGNHVDGYTGVFYVFDEDVDDGLGQATDCGHADHVATDEARDCVRRLVRERLMMFEEIKASFDLRYKADMRAITRWRQAHPDRPDTWPDHTELVVWLMERLDSIDSTDIDAMYAGSKSLMEHLVEHEDDACHDKGTHARMAFYAGVLAGMADRYTDEEGGEG